jgi:riboflavin kinase/FMN adenylyltransferase
VEVVRGFRSLTSPLTGTVVTLGNFDGVHLGHQALFRLVVERARNRGGKAVVYTFEPHPVRILNPSLAPPRITPEAEKLRLIEAHGPDVCIVEPFTAELAAVSADDFVAKALVQALGVSELVVGYDFTYGKGGAGNTRTLEQAGERFGFALTVVRPQTFGGVVASSTKIREFIHEGKVEGAAMLLGRDYTLEGTVVRGDGFGRQLGFPTANIDTDYELLPRYGIYAGWLELDGERVGAVTSLGLRPTVSTQSLPTIEAYLFDFNRDIYGRRVRLSFSHRLRDEQRFDSIARLKEAIAADASQARKVLGL